MLYRYHRQGNIDLKKGPRVADKSRTHLPRVHSRGNYGEDQRFALQFLILCVLRAGGCGSSCAGAALRPAATPSVAGNIEEDARARDWVELQEIMLGARP